MKLSLEKDGGAGRCFGGHGMGPLPPTMQHFRIFRSNTFISPLFIKFIISRTKVETYVLYYPQHCLNMWSIILLLNVIVVIIKCITWYRTCIELIGPVEVSEDCWYLQSSLIDPVLACRFSSGNQCLYHYHILLPGFITTTHRDGIETMSLRQKCLCMECILCVVLCSVCACVNWSILYILYIYWVYTVLWPMCFCVCACMQGRHKGGTIS